MKLRYWTPAEEETLRREYATADTRELAAKLGRTVQRVLAKANALGLHKTRETIARIARDRTLAATHGSVCTRFQPGTQPWNKGISYTAGGRSADTRFKPGHRPHTWVPVGSYRVVQRGGVPELQLKVNDDPGPTHMRWRPLARLVLEQEHGQVPDGHVVVFRPGMHTTDPERVTLDAVELVTRQELMRRNTIHRLPPQFAEIARLKASLHKAINRRTRKEGQPA